MKLWNEGPEVAVMSGWGIGTRSWSGGSSGRSTRRITPTPPRWRGGNASAWRSDLLAVDGFDMQMGYGGQDAEIGDRLDNLGVRAVRVRFRAPTVHLWHERPWRDEAGFRQNTAHRHAVRAGGITRARSGISGLSPAAADQP